VRTLRGAPLVSVVLPTRDRRDLLARAIESVQQQSYRNWELLIVDDGSVDRTADFLVGLATIVCAVSVTTARARARRATLR
jgi:glycosyltransferase involved in cell wall biosynthesis